MCAWVLPGGLLGSFLVASWVSPECLLGASWVSPECLLGAFWVPPECLLGASWAPPEFILGSLELEKEVVGFRAGEFVQD